MNTLASTTAPASVAPGVLAVLRKALATPSAGAIASIALVIGGYFAIAYSIKPLLDGVTVAGYQVDWAVWTSSILSLMVLGWVKLRRGDLASLGLTRPRSYWKGLLLGVVATIGVYAAVVVPVLTMMTLGWITPPPESATAVLINGPSLTLSITLSLVVMWVNAAFGEELLFRGFLMNNLENVLGKGIKSGLAAAAIIALVFGAMHVPSQGLYGLVITGMAGFALGIVFLIGKRNLLPVVIAHGLVNSFGIVLEALSMV